MLRLVRSGALKNTVVVENLRGDYFSHPWKVKCLDENSFVGGNISAIGTDVTSLLILTIFVLDDRKQYIAYRNYNHESIHRHYSQWHKSIPAVLTNLTPTPLTSADS